MFPDSASCIYLVQLDFSHYTASFFISAFSAVTSTFPALIHEEQRGVDAPDWSHGSLRSISEWAWELSASLGVSVAG